MENNVLYCQAGTCRSKITIGAGGPYSDIFSDEQLAEISTAGWQVAKNTDGRMYEYCCEECLQADIDSGFLEEGWERMVVVTEDTEAVAESTPDESPEGELPEAECERLAEDEYLVTQKRLKHLTAIETKEKTIAAARVYEETLKQRYASAKKERESLQADLEEMIRVGPDMQGRITFEEAGTPEEDAGEVESNDADDENTEASDDPEDDAEDNPEDDTEPEENWRSTSIIDLPVTPSVRELLAQRFDDCGQVADWLCNDYGIRIRGIGESKRDAIADAIVRLSGTQLPTAARREGDP